MRKSIIIAFIILCFISCIKQNELSFENSIKYQPEFSVPLGKPEILMEEFVNTLNNLKEIPDSLISDTSAFLYENTYYAIPEKLSNEYTQEFSLNMLEEETDRIISLMFRSNVNNRIPGVVLLQVYFADDTMQNIDSLYHSGPLEIKAADIDENGNVTNEIYVQKDTYFDENRIQSISGTKYITIHSSLTITNLEGIIAKFYSTQDLTIQLGARVGLNIEIN